MEAFVLGSVALILWWRVEPLLTRLLDLAELRAKVPDRPPPPLPTPPIPADMLAGTLGFSEAWAREQALTRLRELYGDLGDWNAVRTIWLAENQ